MGGSIGFHGIECIHRDIRHAGGCDGGSRRNGRTSRRGGWVHHDDGAGISTDSGRFNAITHSCVCVEDGGLRVIRRSCHCVDVA